MSLMYKIRLKKNELSNLKKIRFQISVGQEYHEGDKFLATVEWARTRFEDISLNLCDSLQRHNFEFLGLSPFSAFSLSLKKGDEWLERNSRALSLINPQITRWEDWKKDPRWYEIKNDTDKLYNSDLAFRIIINDSVESIWQRRSSKTFIPLEEKPLFFKTCEKYLLEEVAVSAIMSSDNIAEIYPGSFPRPLYYLRDKNMPAPRSMTEIGFLKSKRVLREAA